MLRGANPDQEEMILDKSYSMLLAGVLAMAGCGSTPTGTMSCTLEARAGVSVDVRDSISNALVGRGSSVVVREGSAVIDSAYNTGVSDGPYPLVYERTGTFTVTVTKAGYQPWSKAGVQVVSEGCHVGLTSVTARLQK
jgi:hypothetical protein